MRALLLTPLLLAFAQPAFADDLPPGVAQLLTCGHVYSMKSDDAKAAGDEGGATEFFHMGDALVWQARTTMDGAGYAADTIEDVVMNNALVTGFRYGAGEADTMFEECLAAADSP